MDDVEGTEVRPARFPMLASEDCPCGARLLLEGITRIQGQYLAGEVGSAFEQLAALGRQLVGSQHALIGEVRWDGAEPVVRPIARDASPPMGGRPAPPGPDELEQALADRDGLVARLLREGRPLLVNEPTAAGPTRAIDSFLGVPLRHREQVVGVLALANRPGGFQQELLGQLEPLLVACAAMVEARRAEQARRDADARQAELGDWLARADRVAALGTLAGGLAHQINNPLAIIKGSLQAATEGVFGPPPGGHETDAIASVEEAQVAVARVQEVAAALQALARPEAATTELLELPELVGRALALCGNEIRHRAALQRHDRWPPPVAGDAGALVQLIAHLLVDGARGLPAADAARSAVSITTHGEEGRAVLEVTAVHQGSPPQPPDARGVGLTICRAIAAAHGGELGAQGVPGGSRVSVRLPGTSRERPAPPHDPPVLSLAWPRRRVLVVDDEPAILSAVARLLRGEFEVVTQADPQAALVALRGGGYDAVVCDLMMPRLTGMELFAQAVRERPELEARFVFVTGGTFTEEARAFARAYSERLLTKPFDLDLLRGAIRRAVSR